MILSTTYIIEGHPVKEYKGLVTGETIIGANFIKDIKASIRDFLGGRSSSYEKVLTEAKDVAIEELKQRAINLGANAVIGLSINYGTVGNQGSMLMVAVQGTAVVI